MTLIDFLDRGRDLSRDLPCLVDGEITLSYDEVVDWSHRIAWALDREGVQPGARVAFLTYNHIWGYVSLLGLQRARAVWAPLNARSGIDEMIGHLARTQTEWLFVHSEFTEHIERIRREAPTLKGIVSLDQPIPGLPVLATWAPAAAAFPMPAQDPADDDFRITSSGGTTGESKAIVQTQRAVEIGVATFLASLRYDEKPRYLLANPMTHVAGIASFHVLALGGTIHIIRTPEIQKVIDEVERHRINMLMLTPTSLYALLAAPDIATRDFSSMQYLMLGAAPISEAKLREAIDLFGPIILQAFGQAEASPVMTLMLPQDYAEALEDPTLSHRIRSCGRAAPFSRLAVAGEDGTIQGAGRTGEIVARGAMVMRGYWRDGELAERETRSGWHGTGDIGYIDEDGFVYIVDRIRDLIISGGFNIFPSEVEQVIWSHPAVQDCVVIGLPDEKWGEAVTAIATLKPGGAASEREILEMCRARLGGVKAPKVIEFWDELPKSALGKVLKKEVRKILLEREAVA